MKRRNFLSVVTGAAGLAGVSGLATLPTWVMAEKDASGLPNAETIKIALKQASAPMTKIEKLVLTKDEWKKRLTPAQYSVLRDEGTERPNSSPLGAEKRKGVFHCSGCDLPVFSSEMKYESGTGWPSFYATLPGAFEKSRDFKLIYPRTEYHCARCGGHHGHLFTDGPQPTGQRWCNNGVSLVFKPAES